MTVFLLEVSDPDNDKIYGFRGRLIRRICWSSHTSSRGPAGIRRRPRLLFLAMTVFYKVSGQESAKRYGFRRKHNSEDTLILSYQRQGSRRPGIRARIRTFYYNPIRFLRFFLSRKVRKNSLKSVFNLYLCCAWPGMIFISGLDRKWIGPRERNQIQCCGSEFKFLVFVYEFFLAPLNHCIKFTLKVTVFYNQLSLDFV